MGFFDFIIIELNNLLLPLLKYDPTPNNPILTVFVISTGIALLTTIANKLLVDQDEMNAINKEMKEFQKEMREAQRSGDGKQMARLQAQQTEMMQKQSAMMTNSFKPMIVTFVPIIIIFWWMRSSVISSLIVHLPPAAYYISLTPIWHFIGPIIYGGESTIPFAIGWLLWYMICTFAMSQIIRKFLGFKDGF